MFKFAVAIFAIIFGPQLQAVQVYQSLMPSEGKHELTPGISLIGGTGEGAVGTTKFETRVRGSALGVSYYYGFLQNHALGIAMSYSSTEQEVKVPSLFFTSTDKYKGWNDIALSYKGLHEIENLSIFFKLGYTLGLEKAKYNNDSNEGNRASGQNQIRFEIGASAPVNEDFILGGIINYNKRQDGERTETTLGVDSTVNLSKGDSRVISAFFEVNNELHPNVMLSTTTFYSGEETTAGVTTTSSGLSYASVTGSARWEARPDLFIIPELIVQTMVDQQGYDHLDTAILSCGARFIF